MPRRVFEYARNLETLNDWVSISSFLLGGSILIFVINFVMSRCSGGNARSATRGGPAAWNGRPSSPPPPENFEQVPVILSGPYDYGVQERCPVADLNPPPGVIAARLRASGHRRGGIEMSDTDGRRPRRPEPRPRPRRRAIYHEAALNATWTGSRLAIGGLIVPVRRVPVRLLLPAVAQLHGLWQGPGYVTPRRMRLRHRRSCCWSRSAPPCTTFGLQRIKAGPQGAWQVRAALVALAARPGRGRAADLPALRPAVPRRAARASPASSPASTRSSWSSLAALIWLEILLAGSRFIPAIRSWNSRPPTLRPSRCSGSSPR